MKRWLLILVPGAAVLAAFAALWLLWIGPGPTREPRTIIVEQGASLTRVAGQLEEAGAIRGGARSFRMLARHLGGARSLRDDDRLGLGKGPRPRPEQPEGGERGEDRQCRQDDQQ